MKNAKHGGSEGRSSESKAAGKPSQSCAGESDPLLNDPSPSIAKLLLMTIFTFPMALIWSTMALIVLPAEALWLFPGNESIFLGVFLVIIGISQLVCPAVGLLSDRHRSKWGRRRPFIVGGTLAAFLGTAFCWSSSMQRQGWFYILGLFASMLALNTVHSAQASIVPDFYNEKKGAASGIVAALTAAGNMFGMIYVVAYAESDFHLAYGGYLTMLTVAAMVVCISVDEKPTDQADTPPVAWQEIAKSYYLDIKRYPDFFWVCVGRTFYYMSTSALTFMYYYLRDEFGLVNEGVIRAKLAEIVILAMSVGIISSIPLGSISDKVGRKPLVYFACVMMGLVYIGFLLCPYLGPEYRLHGIFALAAVYGLVSSCYISVDYALALDCLPSKQAEKDAEAGVPIDPVAAKGDAEALGLWGIAGFVGSAMGPLVGGVALEVFGGWGAGGRYSYQGYVAIMGLSALYSVAAAWFTRYIVGVR